ncbi:protein ycaC [Uncinocarpus reesii 1704]|uniref:Protein ycaC n=1 Tax=Uncinocarpus reesii (strain UAMH 1704) TaxID=336963 RepID=C4JR66_UNCRE|nr:protein ycaC [Uncinocarpus reesii 1704]EEP78702.1 protein ycaC [Uncinocarpus reesii 1704]
MAPKYTRLDRENCAFLFIDHQSGLIQLVRDFEADEFKNNVEALVDIAKYFKIPSILTTSFDSGPNGPIVKEIARGLPDAPLIRRPGQINAMDNEEFVNAIKKTAHKRLSQHGVQLLNWVAIAAELHRDWRNDIEGFGKIWTDHVPGYWCLAQSYEVAKGGK